MDRLASQRSEGTPQHWTGRCSLPHNVFIWLLGLEIRFSRFQIIILLTEPLPDHHQADHSIWSSSDSQGQVNLELKAV